MKRALLVCTIAACSGDDGMTVQPDATPIADVLHCSGKAVAYSANGTTPLEGVRVGAYASADEATEVVFAMTDAEGNYTIDLVTNGVALDGYFKATKTGYMETYLYPDGPVKVDFSGARVAMLAPDTFTLLADTLCGANQQATNAAIVAIVSDEQEHPIAGATIGSSPGATKYCYNEGGYPNRNATHTDADGIGYYLNVPAGRVTVNALKTGLTLPSHPVLARAGVITTTLIRP
jgi:hypothetical protein